MFPINVSLVQSDIYSARKSLLLVFVARFYPTLTNDKKQKYISSGDEQKTLRFYTVQTFMEVPNGMMKWPEKTGLVLLKITLTLKV